VNSYEGRKVRVYKVRRRRRRRRKDTRVKHENGDKSWNLRRKHEEETKNVRRGFNR
jgi:hypothetical protein